MRIYSRNKLFSYSCLSSARTNSGYIYRAHTTVWNDSQWIRQIIMISIEIKMASNTFRTWHIYIRWMQYAVVVRYTTLLDFPHSNHRNLHFSWIIYERNSHLPEYTLPVLTNVFQCTPSKSHNYSLRYLLDLLQSYVNIQNSNITIAIIFQL